MGRKSVVAFPGANLSSRGTVIARASARLGLGTPSITVRVVTCYHTYHYSGYAQLLGEYTSEYIGRLASEDSM